MTAQERAGLDAILTRIQEIANAMRREAATSSGRPRKLALRDYAAQLDRVMGDDVGVNS